MIKQLELEITSETQAFKVLQAALNDEYEGKNVALTFSNWPVLEIKFVGDGYDSAITADMAESIIAVQTAVNRAYARAKHRSSTARSLTLEERQALKFKATVRKGSSLVSIDLGKFAETLAHGVIDKMSPTELILMVLGVSVLGTGLFAYKAFLKHKSADKLVSTSMEERIKMSALEARKLEIMAAVVHRVPAIAYAEDDFNEARAEILRAANDAKTVEISGLTLDSETAKSLSTSKRSESKQIQLNAQYFISATDLRQEGSIKLKIKSKADGREFFASFTDDSLDRAHIQALQQAEWDRTPVYLSVNATELRGEITSATIVSATHAEVPAAKK